MALHKSSCEVCQCARNSCGDEGGLHLHVEIENLKQRLLEKENHIVSMETNFLKEAEKFPNGEHAALMEELLTWQEKYSRLYEAHKRVQKVNQSLEDKLLKIVDKCETEKSSLSTEIGNLTRKLVDEQFTVSKLQEDNERYKTDLNLALQFLHCKPSNFVPQRLDAVRNIHRPRRHGTNSIVVRNSGSSVQRANDNRRLLSSALTRTFIGSSKEFKYPTLIIPGRPTADSKNLPYLFLENTHLTTPRTVPSYARSFPVSMNSSAVSPLSLEISHLGDFIYLPADVQAKVRSHLNPKSARRFPDGNGNLQTRHEMKTIKVPIPTFPPTAMVYSLDKSPIDKDLDPEDGCIKSQQSSIDIVSAAIMAKVLEEREKERTCVKHCRTCRCSSGLGQSSKCIQTDENDILFFTTFDFDNKQLMKNGSGSEDMRLSDFSPFPTSSPKMKHPNSNYKSSKRETSKSGFSNLSKMNSYQALNSSYSDEKLIQEINSSCNNCNNNISSSNLNNNKQNKHCLTNVSIPSADKFSTDSDNDSPSTSCNLISFDNSSLSSTENCKENTSTKVSPVGPRLCSVRMQAGSSNILLDNAVNPYSTPVLYRSKFVNESTEPLVHLSRSRSTSVSSGTEDIPPVQKKFLCAETEI